MFAHKQSLIIGRSIGDIVKKIGKEYDIFRGKKDFKTTSISATIQLFNMVSLYTFQVSFHEMKRRLKCVESYVMF